MAFFDDEDIITNDETPKPSIDIAYEDYKDVSTNLSKDLDAEFITSLEGTPWYVDVYYSSVVAGDTVLTSYDPDKSPLYQQYRAIIDMELKVPDGTGLEPSFDEEGKATLSGEALVYPGLRPNKTDCFIARLADGRRALFTVIDAKDLSYLKNTATRISFTIISYLTESTEKDLEAKTAGRYYFNKDNLSINRNPIISEKDHALSGDLDKALKGIADRWYREFVKEGYSSIGVPKQPVTLYDAFLIKALRKAVDERFHRQIGTMTSLSLSGTEGHRCLTIFDTLVDPDDVLYDSVVDRMIRVGRRQLPYSRDYGTASVSPYEEFIYPSSEFVDDIVHETGTWRGITNPIAASDLDVTETLPLFGDMFTDEYYVFSKSFYTELKATSVLESQVIRRINNEHLDSTILLDLCRGWKTLNTVHRFYYGPVLMLLLMYKFRSF